MELVKALEERLSPEWIRECVMFSKNQRALVIAPKRCLEHGVKVIQIAQSSFGSRTILSFRLDYDLLKVKA